MYIVSNSIVGCGSAMRVAGAIICATLSLKGETGTQALENPLGTRRHRYHRTARDDFHRHRLQKELLAHVG